MKEDRQQHVLGNMCCVMLNVVVEKSNKALALVVVFPLMGAFAPLSPIVELRLGLILGQST